ncbi:MAG: phage integrase SAM-like domain-containing protein, partial [Bacteroidota bacterium]
MKAIDFSLIHSSQRKKRLRKDGNGPIWVKAYQSGRHKYYNTGVAVAPKEWDAKRCKVVKHPNAVAYTAKINRKLSELENYQIALINEHYGEHVSLNDFDERYRLTGGQKMTFTAFYELAVKQRKEIIRSTRLTQLNTLRHFRIAVGEVSFAELRYSTIESFHQYLLGEEKELTTIDKFHRHIKTYINMAIRRGLMLSSSNPYQNFKYDKGKSRPREFLRLEELEAIQNIPRELLTEDQIKVRDMFMIMALLG